MAAYRLAQPVGQSYTHQKGSHSQDALSTLKAENQYLKQQNDVLKSTKNWKGVVREVVLNVVEELKSSCRSLKSVSA